MTHQPGQEGACKDIAFSLVVEMPITGHAHTQPPPLVEQGLL